MKELLLRAKHWQIFIPLIVPTVMSQYYSSIWGASMNQASINGENPFEGVTYDSFMTDYGMLIGVFLLLYLVNLVVQYGWYYAVINRLGPEVANGGERIRKRGNVYLVITILGLLLVIWGGFQGFRVAEFLGNGGDPEAMGQDPVALITSLVLPLALGGGASAVGTILACVQVGKIIRSIEMGKPAPGGEYAGYAILAILLVIGIWMLQPKINRYLEAGRMEKDEIQGLV